VSSPRDDVTQSMGEMDREAFRTGGVDVLVPAARVVVGGSGGRMISPGGMLDIMGAFVGGR
jgi:hypothetical protein